MVQVSGKGGHGAVVGIAGTGSLAASSRTTVSAAFTTIVELEDVERSVLVVVALAVVELLAARSSR